MQEGGFDFADQHWPLPLNHPWEPVPVHGEGWISEWQVTESAATAAVLEFRHDGAQGFPFPYRARESFALTPQSLRVEVAVVNTGDIEMPAGTGLHPYFDRTDDSTLELEAAGVREAGEGPPEPGPVPVEWDFSTARVLDAKPFEVLYSGWKRRATIAWPDRGVAVVMTAGAPPRPPVPVDARRPPLLLCRAGEQHRRCHQPLLARHSGHRHPRARARRERVRLGHVRALGVARPLKLSRRGGAISLSTLATRDGDGPKKLISPTICVLPSQHERK